MNHRLLVLSGLAALAMLVPTSAAAASVRVGRAPTLPPGAHHLGALADQARLRLAVALAPRDPAALAAYAQAASTPGSPVFHRYLTVEQFAQRFGPTPQQIAAVHASLSAHGLQPGPVSANGLAIQLSPTAAQTRRAFSIGLERYTLAGGRHVFANTTAPALDPGVAHLVQGVVGLNDLTVPKPLGVPRVPNVTTGGPQPCAPAASFASNARVNTADQLASAYGFPSLYGRGDLGAGQTIALYELEPYTQSDVDAYQSCYGTSTSVSNIPIDGGATGGQVGEAALDIEAVIGLAPQAKILVYNAPNDAAGAVRTFLRAVGDDQAQVISTSWGLCEDAAGSGYANIENDLFQEAATQGQSIVAASGDDGAEACTDSQGQPVNQLGVSDPAAQPFVTGVGGTTLTALGPPPGETVWNNSSSGASGGGISKFWPMPDYQSTAPAALHVTGGDTSGAPCGSPTFCREVPDVSADADPFTGYAIFFNGNWEAFGGTSASAPLWGALLALTNASAVCAGPPIGFANPALYRAAASASTFNDVTSGNNDFTGTGGFSARAGYDMSTGLGTPNGASLPAWLCFRDIVTNPGNQSSLAGTPAGLHLSATSSTGAPLSLDAAGLPPGLTLDSATGTVAGTVASPGTFTVTVGASDANGATGATSFQWLVRPATVALKGPRNQKGTVGKRQTLNLSATVDNGRTPSYSATGLPPGLSVSPQTGTVSGVPKRSGRYKVTATARDASGAADSARFTWTIGHALRASRAGLSGVAKRSPRLLFTLSSRDRGAIRTISIELPKGLSFANHPRGIALGGKHPKFKVTVKHGMLVVKLSKGVSSVRMTVPAGALRASASLARKVAGGHAGKLAVRISAADAKRLATQVTLRLRPS